MENRHLVPVIALLALVCCPAAAVAGYDIAHIVERTCEPGGPLIVADEWKRDGVVTVPGEVIGCPRDAFQIAAGPERIGGEAHLCAYFSLRGDDGADICFVTESAGVNPLMVIEADRSGRLELVGIAGENVALASVGIAGELTVIPIERQRAARLGATRAFRFFSLTVDRRALCADRRIAEIAIPASTRLLSAADRVPYARSLEALCEDEPVGLGSLLRWLLRALI